MEAETYQCEECDREFDTQTGVNLHSLRVHKGMGPGHPGWGLGPKVVCKVCNKRVSQSYLARHMARHDKQYKEVKEWTRPDENGSAAVTSTQERTFVPIVQSTKKARYTPLDQFVVLQRDDGSIWLAEMIRE